MQERGWSVMPWNLVQPLVSACTWCTKRCVREGGRLGCLAWNSWRSWWSASAHPKIKNILKSRISAHICLYLVISVYICLNEYTSLALPPDTNLYEYKFIRIPICTNVLQIPHLYLYLFGYLYLFQTLLCDLPHPTSLQLSATPHFPPPCLLCDPPGRVWGR
jgi:hypothetical protein